MKYLIGDDLGMSQRKKMDLGKEGGGGASLPAGPVFIGLFSPLPSHDLGLPVHAPRLLGGIEESRSQDDNFENW